MSLRVKRRAAETNELLNECVAERSAMGVVSYSEDRLGSVTKRRKLLMEETRRGRRSSNASLLAAAARKSTASETALLKKILLNSDKKNSNKNREGRGKEEEGDEGAVDDIWAAEATSMPSSSSSSSVALLKKKKLLPSDTISYHPSKDAHQEALAEAHSLELKKREEDQRRIAEALSLTSSKAVVVSLTKADDDDSEEEDGEGEEGEEGGNEDGEGRKVRGGLSRRQSTKFTRAQRNKIRARNIAGFHASLSRNEDQLLASINKVPEIVRALDEEEKRRAAELEVKRLLEAEREREEGRGMTYEEAGLVPLSDELRGSLRQMLPKGVLVKTMETDMRLSGKLAVKDRRKARKGEHPHSARNIRWVAKHKYT